MSLYVDIEKQLSSCNLKVRFEQKDGILGFLGQSGSGKSMTLKCIAGLEKPTKGKIILNDKVLFDSEKKINLSTQERNIGFLFQNYALFPHMTVSENIELGLTNLSKKEKAKISKEYIEKIYLKGFENRYPWQLSGGQQQRVALARALATSPQILLLDEPFSALDNHLRHTMEKELINILESYNGDVVFVTHDIGEAYRVCDDIMVYDRGIGLQKRDKKSLFKSPRTLAEARITGCKNVSDIEVRGDGTVYALDWGVELKVGEPIENNIRHVGIRKHHVEIIREEDNRDDENVFKFDVQNVIENPFSYTIYIKNKNNKYNKTIQIEVYKNQYELTNEKEIVVRFPKDSLFCF